MLIFDIKRKLKNHFFLVSLEGALGKITSLTVRNPRQVLQVSEKKPTTTTTTTTTMSSGSQEGGKQDQKQSVSDF